MTQPSEHDEAFEANADPESTLPRSEPHPDREPNPEPDPDADPELGPEPEHHPELDPEPGHRRSGIGLLDEAAQEAALVRQGQLTKPAGSLGLLEDLSVWLCGVQGQCPPRSLDRVQVVLFAGDHGIAKYGVSAYPPEVTAQMVLNFLAGGAAVNVLAASLGAQVRVVDISVDIDYVDDLGADVPAEVTKHKVQRGSGAIDRVDAMTAATAATAFAAGAAIADELADNGVDLLIPGDMGIGNTTPAAVLIGLLTRRDPVSVSGRGTGIDDNGWMRKTAAIRDAMRRGRPVLGDPMALLATVGGPDIAAMTGFLVQASTRGVPVLLDGVVSLAAALVADKLSHRARHWWQAGHRSTEPAASLALAELGLEPILNARLRLGEGTGALLALPILRGSQITLAQMATFEAAGVSDKDNDRRIMPPAAAREAT